MRELTSTRSSPGRATGRIRLLRWALVGAIFLACAYLLDVGAIVEVLSRISAPWLLLIFTMMTLDRLLMAWKWTLLLRALELEVPNGKVVRIYYQGSLAGIFLPSGVGGDLLRAHWVSRETGSPPRVYASLIMEKMIGFLSAANWAVIGLAVYLAHVPAVSFAWTVALIAGVLVLNGIFVLSLGSRLDNVVLPWLAKLPYLRLRNFVERLYAAYREYGDRRPALLGNGLLTMAEHGLQMLVVLAMAASLGLVEGVVPFVAVTAVYLLIYRLPISPDGWGVGEVASIGLYGLLGIAPESAFGLAFLGHVMQALVVLPGAWFFCRQESPSRSIAEARE